MPIPEPLIDDRRYDEILSEALARIPVHTPEWTNFTESDPGVTIVQLFAFMTESLLYRANRVPERNRLRFLNLLGEGLRPATPARGVVTFDAGREAAPLALGAGTEVFAGQVPFRTRDGLDVLPVEGRVYYKARLDEAARAEARALYDQLYASFLDEGAEAEPYQTRLLEPPTPGAALPVLDLAQDPVDGALWLALLAPRSADPQATRRAIAGRTLTLAVVPAVRETSRVLPPGGQADETGATALRFERPDLRDIAPADPDAARPARYAALAARASDDVLAGPGTVELQLPDADALGTWAGQEPLEAGVGDYPPSLEDDPAADRVVTWVRIRVAGADGDGASAQARVSVVGVNGAVVEQRAQVAAEFVGLGTGEPDQELALVTTPVLPASVALTVDGEAWTEIDDLTAAGAEVQRRGGAFVSAPTPVGGERVTVYALDRASGAVRFGDGLHGARPAKGAVIQASYATGGGTRGLVGIGAISKGAALPGSVTVTNPVPTWGASDAETVAGAEKRIPATLAHRHRLVTAEDFEEITRQTPGVDVGRVEVLPVTRPRGTDGSVVQAAGAVMVVVVPATDVEQPGAPRPDRLFLSAVCDHLDPRRLVTTEVHVRGPAYVAVYVSAGVDAVPGRDLATVREGVRAALAGFLSPLVGGYGEEGWPLGLAVETATLVAVAARAEGVARVNGLLLGTEAGAAGASVALDGVQLPRLAGLAVQSGAALALDGLLGVSQDGPARVPVPVVPASC